MTADGQPAGQRRSTRGFWLGLLLSGVCLAAALWGVDLKRTLEMAAAAHAGYLALAIVVVVLTLFAKARRWQILMEAPAKQPSLRVFKILNIGVFVNAFLPARLGDVYRVFLAGELQGQKKSYLVGTLVIEKISDLAALLLTALVLMFTRELPAWLVLPLRGALLVTLAFLTLLCIAAGKKAWLQRILSQLSQRLKREWLNDALTNGLRSFAMVSQKHTWLKLIFWVALVTILGALTNLLVFRALRIQLGLGAAFFVLVVLMLGISVPASVGRIGVFHYAAVLALSVFDLPKDLAFTYATLLHLVVTLPTLILGGIFLWQEKLSQNLIEKLLTALHPPNPPP
jgi:uncharacterized protein (TIRG00374 family)